MKMHPKSNGTLLEPFAGLQSWANVRSFGHEGRSDFCMLGTVCSNLSMKHMILCAGVKIYCRYTSLGITVIERQTKQALEISFLTLVRCGHGHGEPCTEVSCLHPLPFCIRSCRAMFVDQAPMVFWPMFCCYKLRSQAAKPQLCC